MEGLLLAIEFFVTAWFAYTLYRRDRGEAASRDLGMFHYRDEPGQRGPGAGAAPPDGGPHA